MVMLKKYGFLAVKIGLAAGLIVWLVQSGKLDLRQVAGALRHGPLLSLIVALGISANLLLAVRWVILLRTQNIRIGIWHGISLTMIGALFNNIIPGAVSGDLVKAYYIGANAPDRRTRAITTILVDRVIGLIGLLGLAAAAGSWNPALISHNHILLVLYVSVLALTAGLTVAFLIGVYSGHRIIDWMLRHRLGAKPLVHTLTECIRVVADLRHHLPSLAATVGLTVVIQMMVCLMYYFGALALNSPAVSFQIICFTAAIGLAATALPIAPAGIGVGQAVFYALYNLTIGNGPLGSSTTTLYQIVMILTSAMGLYFYLRPPKITTE